MHTYACVHTCANEHMYVHTYRGQRLASVVFLSHSTTYVFMEGLSLNLRLAGLTRLSGQILASGLGVGGDTYGTLSNIIFMASTNIEKRILEVQLLYYFRVQIKN